MPTASTSDPLLPTGPSRPRSALARGDVLWGFGRRARDVDGRRRVRIVWGRLIAFGLLLSVGAWLSLGFAAWGFVRWSQGVPTVSPWDMLALPVRWQIYQQKRGDQYIAKAREYFESGDFGSAFQLLRVGVFKSPANLEGRLRLAQVYALLLRQPAQGVKLLEEGMQFSGGDAEYLETYLALLFANQEDERAREVAAARFATAPAGTRQAQVFALAAAQACFLRANYDEARDFLVRGGIDRATEGQILQAQIEWEQGHRKFALDRLQQLINGSAATEHVYDLLAGYLRETEKTDEARAVATLRVLAFPQSLTARLALLRVCADGKDFAKVDREVDAVLRDLGRDQRVVLALADFAAATANITLADRVRGMTEGAGLAPEIGPLMAIAARVAAADYHGALAEIERLRQDGPPWLDAQDGPLSGMQAVANFGIARADLGELYLNKFLDQEAAPQADRYVAVARWLEAVNALEGARRALIRAVEIDGELQAALTELVALDLRTGHLADLPRNLDHLLAMRKPPLDLLQQAYQQLSREDSLRADDHEPLLAKLRAAIQKRDRNAVL